MKLRNVKPQDIVVPEVRVTAHWEQDLYQMFRESMKEVGMIEPPICMTVDGRLTLVDGLHRLEEAIAQGLKLIPVVVIEGSPDDLYFYNLAQSRLRGKVKASNMVQVIFHLWKERGIDIDELRRRTGFSRDYIEKLLTIGEASPEVRQALDEEEIGVGVAYAISRCPDYDLQNNVLAQWRLYRWTVAETEQFIRDVYRAKAEAEEVRPIPVPAQPRKTACYYCGEEHDLGHIANPSICPTCSGLLVAMVREQRRQDAAGGGA